MYVRMYVYCPCMYDMYMMYTVYMCVYMCCMYLFTTLNGEIRQKPDVFKVKKIFVCMYKNNY